jgi:hypothetical protein
VKGAAIIGATPYLEYPRFFEACSDRLSPEIRADISDKIANILDPCRIKCIIVAAITSLAKFTRIISVARDDPTRSIKFHPDALVEEWYWVEYQLVRYPGPLRDEHDLGPDTVHLSPPQADSSTTLVADLTNPIAARIKYVLPRNLKPTPSANLLEPAVRLAGVLYIEEMMPDEPRTLNTYAILLELLKYQLRVIMDVLRERQTRLAMGTLGAEEGGDNRLPSLAALRPVMIWICLTGYVVAGVADKHDSPWVAHRYDRSVYRECLATVVGPFPEYVDYLAEEDFALLKLLSIRDLRVKKWDNKSAMKEMLRENMLGEHYTTPPLTP